MADGKLFTLEVVTPERVIFTGAVTTVVAPAANGYLGVLAHHAPLIALLAPGRIVYRTPEGTTVTLASQGSGLLEVRDNRLTILADRIAA